MMIYFYDRKDNLLASLMRMHDRLLGTELLLMEKSTELLR